MLKTRTLYLMTALLLGLAALEPSSAESQKLSVQEPALSLASAQDYWSASRNYIQMANEHIRHNETAAACEALAKSLDYYRMALAKETTTADQRIRPGARRRRRNARDPRPIRLPRRDAYWTPARHG